MTAFPLMEEGLEISAVATITKDITLRKHMEADLRASQVALRELSRKSIEALESDRQTVAREVHDGIAGNLSAVKFSLEVALRKLNQEANPLATAVSGIVGNLTDTIKESKRIAANLRPLSIDDLGLLATVDWYIKQSAERYPDIRLACEVKVEESEIPETQKLVIYRIVQESLANAFKHSNADRVSVSLVRKKDYIEISIKDNGVGFDYQNIATRKNRLGGFGLRSMQERTEIAGGSLWVVSQEKGGTSVTALLPLST
jgi:signal transduction histidine kinase